VRGAARFSEGRDEMLKEDRTAEGGFVGIRLSAENPHEKSTGGISGRVHARGGLEKGLRKGGETEWKKAGLQKETCRKSCGRK